MVSERQSSFEELLNTAESSPKPWDFKAWIPVEHRLAELQRLDSGQDGCGCSQCQELYKTLDLAKYGNRVLRAGELVFVKAAANRAPADYWLNESIFVCDGHAWTTGPDLQRVCLGKVGQVKEALEGGKIVGDITGQAREVLAGMINIKKENSNDGERTKPTEHAVKSTVKQRAIRTNHLRARATSGAQFKPVDTRLVKARKTSSFRKA